MRKDRTKLMAFLVGFAFFTIPAGMLFSRSQAVETTDFHMSPSVVTPGQEFEAVWTDTPLRAGCTGVVNRRFTGVKDGNKTSWVLPAVHVVLHGAVGVPEQFRTTWRVPHLDPGTEGVFKKHVKRWCNLPQELLWPMEEDQEAIFSVE